MKLVIKTGVMDTHEARARMHELAREAARLVAGFRRGDTPSFDNRVRLREMLAEARSLLPDAGFPAEPAWRGLQRASIGVETLLDGSDPLYWKDVGESLNESMSTLESLIAGRSPRETDFHIVG